MRRLRTVSIKVSENFYRFLEAEKNKFREDITKRTGFRKDITTVNFTNILANNKIVFPKIKLGGLEDFKRQKRRCI